MSGYALDIPNRLTVYGNEAVKTFYQRAFDLEGRQDDTRLHYQVIQPYSRIKERKLVTDKTIYVANHFLTMAACLMRRWRLYLKSMKSLRVMMV